MPNHFPWLFQSEVAQSCPTLCNPMDCSPPGSSIHGIFWARILEWGAISLSGESSWPRDWTRVSCIAGRLYRLSHQGIPNWVVNQILLNVWDVALITNKLAPHGFGYFCCRGDHTLKSESETPTATEAFATSMCPDSRKTTRTRQVRISRTAWKIRRLEAFMGLLIHLPTFPFKVKAYSTPGSISKSLQRGKGSNQSFLSSVSPGLSRGMYYHL